MTDEQPEQTAEWQIFTLVDAYAGREPTRYIVDGIFSTHSLSVVYGAPASMKSMLLADLSAHVVAGVPWLPGSKAGGGILVEARPALWIDMDNGQRRTHERFDAVAKAMKLPASAPLYYVSMPTPPLVASDINTMMALKLLAQRVSAGIVVIDNLGLITGNADENSAQMAVIMGNLRVIAERTGAAVVVVHHQRKGGAAGSRPGDALRGHSSIEAAVDLALHIVRDPDNGELWIRSTKTRGVDVEPLRANFHYEHRPGTKDLALAWFDGAPMPKGAEAIQDIIIEVVRQNQPIGKTKAAELVKDRLADIGINRIRAEIDDMVADGDAIREEASGKFKRLVTA